MPHRHRTPLRDGGLLVLLASAVIGLVALVYSGSPSPRLIDNTAPAPQMAARGPIPTLTTYALNSSDTRHATRLQAALDHIGYDLDAVAAGYVSVPRVLLASLPADLDAMDQPEARKALFLRALLPVILAVNDRIGDERAFLLKTRDKLHGNETLTAEEVGQVMQLASTYDEPDADVDALLRKVDVIPPSLALAQAIEESGWGTSRLARHNNALFGQFGMDDDGNYDYANFASLTEAVEAYAHNLNTHHAYREFRQARAHMRAKTGGLEAMQLAPTLHRYSERGVDYVGDLRSIIAGNGLEAYDGARLAGRTNITLLASAER